MIKDTNLVVGEITRKYSDTVDQGLVISAKPEPETSVRVDTAIELVVSKGLPPVNVPDLVGDSTDSAQNQLDKFNLEYAESGEEYDNKVPAGSIISQDPTAGTSVPQGSTVSVVVSLGPPLVEVPDVFDMPLEQAIAELERPVSSTRPSTSFGVSPFDRVATQDPGRRQHGPQGQRRRARHRLMAALPKSAASAPR